VEILSSAVGIGGIALAGVLFLGERRFVTWLAATLPGRLLGRLWLSGWGFDWLYERLFVDPFVWFAKKNERDGFDLAILAIPLGLRSFNGALVRTQTGQIRWYAASMALGAVLLIAAVMLS
jgi:NADH-quinone oxidoreductase subunit L